MASSLVSRAEVDLPCMAPTESNNIRADRMSGGRTATVVLLAEGEHDAGLVDGRVLSSTGSQSPYTTPVRRRFGRGHRRWLKLSQQAAPQPRTHSLSGSSPSGSPSTRRVAAGARPRTRSRFHRSPATRPGTCGSCTRGAGWSRSGRRGTEVGPLGQRRSSPSPRRCGLSRRRTSIRSLSASNWSGRRSSPTARA